jgi:hypothetical protein
MSPMPPGIRPPPAPPADFGSAFSTTVSVVSSRAGDRGRVLERLRLRQALG